jgi:hypothetical protein
MTYVILVIVILVICILIEGYEEIFDDTEDENSDEEK